MVRHNIEKMRKARKLTKTYLGSKVGLTCQGYRHIANGAVRLDVERFIRIAGVLCVPPEVLLSDQLTDKFILENIKQ